MMKMKMPRAISVVLMTVASVRTATKRIVSVTAIGTDEPKMDEGENMNQPRGPKDLTNEELLEEFQSAVWADAIDDADQMSSRTVEHKSEILRRMQIGGSG